VTTVWSGGPAGVGGGTVNVEPLHRPKIEDFDEIGARDKEIEFKLGFDDLRETAGDAAGVL